MSLAYILVMYKDRAKVVKLVEVKLILIISNQDLIGLVIFPKQLNGAMPVIYCDNYKRSKPSQKKTLYLFNYRY